MPGQRAAQPPVQALVNQDAHGSDRLQHLELSRLDDGDHLLAFYGRETIQEIFNGFAAFEVINQVLERDARADEDRRAAHDFGIGMNHALQVFHLHGARITAFWFACLQDFPVRQVHTPRNMQRRWFETAGVRRDQHLRAQSRAECRGDLETRGSDLANASGISTRPNHVIPDPLRTRFRSGDAANVIARC